MDYKTLNLLYRFNKEFSHQRIRVKEISDTDCIMMTFVYDHPGCSQDDIVQTFRLDKTTVAKALSKLEERKLVTRLRGDIDRRKKALYLTDEGRYLEFRGGYVGILLQFHPHHTRTEIGFRTGTFHPLYRGDQSLDPGRDVLLHNLGRSPGPRERYRQGLPLPGTGLVGNIHPGDKCHTHHHQDEESQQYGKVGDLHFFR